MKNIFSFQAVYNNYLISSPLCPQPLTALSIQNELQYDDVVQVALPGEVTEGPEGTQNTAISQSYIIELFVELSGVTECGCNAAGSMCTHNVTEGLKMYILVAWVEIG